MKAAVIERFEAPLVIREVDVPVIGPEEVLIRVRACGLCGTDLKILSGKFSETPLPLIPGHEIAGEVHEVGNQVKGVSVGVRVVVYIYFSCGVCRFCKAGRDSLCEDSSGHIGFDVNGGMAEFVKAPASSVMQFGSSLSFPQAAALPDAASTVFHALVTRAGLKEGESLVILGVGGLGLNAVQIARTIGAKVFAVDIKDKHLEKATERGAEVALNPDRDDIAEAIQRESGRPGADVVLELTGHPQSMEQGLEWLGSGGKLLVVGYNLTHPSSVFSHSLVRREVEILGCRAMTRRDLAETIKWAEDKKIVPVVDELIPLAEINQAYDRLKEGKVMGRLILEP